MRNIQTASTQHKYKCSKPSLVLMPFTLLDRFYLRDKIQIQLSRLDNLWNVPNQPDYDSINQPYTSTSSKQIV
jgi:hypothetical protein